MRINSENDRFRDEGTLLDEFRNEFLVVCPKCQKMAQVVPFPVASEKINVQLFSPRKLICLNCPHRDTWEGRKILTGSNVDWYFQLPLWLQISCCNETLWAYNFKHLEIIEQYVSAKLRERIPKGRKSFLSKLPQWIKSAKNRDEVLKAIAKLRTKLK